MKLKNVIRILLLLLLQLFVTSCRLGPVKWNGFNNYKEKINISSNKLRFEGVYIEEGLGTELLEGYYFYKNGLCYKKFFTKLNNNMPNIDEIENNIIEYGKFHDDFGCYRIVNDTIITQLFGNNPNEFYSKWVTEEKFIIVNDTTIIRESYYSYLDNKQFPKERNKLNFHTSSIKPDSSNAWFINRSRYKDNLHESRK